MPTTHKPAKRRNRPALALAAPDEQAEAASKSDDGASIASVDGASLFGPVARSSVVDAVADRIRAEILAGRIAAGARLPSERELALSLGVNRLTLRASLARLEALGLIVTKHGAGTVVASWRERAGLEALPALAGALSPREQAWHEVLASVLEVRRILAAEAVALAAERHSDEDLQAMRACAEAQAARTSDLVALARGDIAFMRSVVRAARNVGLELVLNTLARFPDEHPALVASIWGAAPDTLAVYPLVIALVEGGDAAFARVAVREALEPADVETLARARRAAGLPPKSSTTNAPARRRSR